MELDICESLANYLSSVYHYDRYDSSSIDKILNLNVITLIKDVQVFEDKNGKPKTIKVTFFDNVSTVAVCKEPDTFDLYTGIKVCVEKYALGNRVINKIDNIAERASKAYSKGRYKKLNTKNKKQNNKKGE